MRDGVELVEIEDDARLSAAHPAGVRADVFARGAALHAAARRGGGARPGGARRTPAAVHAPAGPTGEAHWSALAAVWDGPSSTRSYHSGRALDQRAAAGDEQ